MSGTKQRYRADWNGSRSDASIRNYYIWDYKLDSFAAQYFLTKKLSVIACAALNAEEAINKTITDFARDVVWYVNNTGETFEQAFALRKAASTLGPASITTARKIALSLLIKEKNHATKERPNQTGTGDI